MRKITSIEIHPDNSQEIIPNFTDEFPYRCSRAEINRYSGKFVPWHWHNAVELFYIESGELEYITPNASMIFPAGTGGFVNSGILHMTRPRANSNETVQLLHLFDPVLISGSQGGRIAEKYVIPMLTSGCEIIPIGEDNQLLDTLQKSFLLDEHERGFELHIRSLLSYIWLQIESIAAGQRKDFAMIKANDKLKHMMVYVHQHYPERIHVSDLAQAVYSSERECYRLFHDLLHCSPLEYITSYRLQIAGDMLKHKDVTITHIAQCCGFGTSSHFGKIFAKHFGCSPREYRMIWQNRDR